MFGLEYEPQRKYSTAFNMTMTTKQVERVMLYRYYTKKMSVEDISKLLEGNLKLAELIDANNKFRCFITYWFFNLWSKIDGTILAIILFLTALAYGVIVACLRNAHVDWGWVKSSWEALKIFAISISGIAFIGGLIAGCVKLWNKFLEWV